MARAVGLTALTGLLGGVALAGCGGEADLPTETAFIDQMKRILESPPADDVLRCMYRGLSGDGAFGRDLMSDQPSDGAKARMRRINASCELDPTGDGAAPTSTTTTSERPRGEPSNPSTSVVRRGD